MDFMQNCFVCNIAIVEEHSFINIFEERYDDGDDAMTALAPELAKILNIEITPNIDDLHSSTVCMSCARDLDTYQDLEATMHILRVEMVCKYRNTLVKLNERRSQQEEVDISNVITDLIDEEVVNSVCCTMSMKEDADNDTNEDVAEVQLSELIENVDEINENGKDEIQQQTYHYHSDNFHMNANADSSEDLLDAENLIEFIDESVYGDDEPFICRECEPATFHHDISTYNQHLGDKHNVPVYKCEVCGDVYISPLELHTHMDAAHAGIIKTNCETCKATFESFAELRKHLKDHAMEFVCHICKKGCATIKHLDYHMATAHNDNKNSEQFQFKCEKCNKILNSNIALNAHQRTHNTRWKGNFACTKCDKHFRKVCTLQQHTMSMHSDRTEYVCKLCEKVFNAKISLKLHMAEHKEIKPYICSTCGKKFARRNDLSAHERVHTGERPYKCDMCDASFAQSANRNSHKKLIHLQKKSFECTICKNSYKRRRLLDFHMKATHTGERPISCTLCPATFVYPDYYKRHLLIHEGVKPFSCEVCGKHFSCRENRNAHLFVHSNKKPYECVDCGEGFMRKPQLMAHKKASNHLSETIIINEPQLSNETRKRFDGQMEEPSSTSDMSDKSSVQNCDTNDFPLDNKLNSKDANDETIISSNK